MQAVLGQTESLQVDQPLEGVAGQMGHPIGFHVQLAKAGQGGEGVTREFQHFVVLRGRVNLKILKSISTHIQRQPFQRLQPFEGGFGETVDAIVGKVL